MVDQGRVLSGGQTFSSDQILAALYSLDEQQAQRLSRHPPRQQRLQRRPRLRPGHRPGHAQRQPARPRPGLLRVEQPADLEPRSPSLPATRPSAWASRSSSRPRAPTPTARRKTSPTRWPGRRRRRRWRRSTPSGLATTRGRGHERDHRVAGWRHEPRRHLDQLAIVRDRRHSRQPLRPRTPQGSVHRHGHYIDGSTHEITDSVAWASSKPSVATIGPRAWPRRWPWARA